MANQNPIYEEMLKFLHEIQEEPVNENGYYIVQGIQRRKVDRLERRISMKLAIWDTFDDYDGTSDIPFNKLIIGFNNRFRT